MRFPLRRSARARRCSSGRPRPGPSRPTSRRRSGRTSPTSGSGRATARFWVGKGVLKRAVQGPVRGPRGEARLGARRLALHGPVRRRCRRCSEAFAEGTRGRPGDAVRAPGRPVDRGRRGRGHGHRPHRAGRRRRGLPARQVARAAGDRADRRGRPLLRGLRLAVRARPPRRSRTTSSTTSSAAGSSTTSSPTPTATRTAGAAARRCSSGSSTSGSSRWARSTTSRATELTAAEKDAQPPLPDHGRRRRDPVDPRLRLRARARLAHEHARLDDQQEALLGPGAADLRLHELRDVRRRRGHRGARGASARRLGEVRGPHAAPAVRGLR